MERQRDNHAEMLPSSGDSQILPENKGEEIASLPSKRMEDGERMW